MQLVGTAEIPIVIVPVPAHGPNASRHTRPDPGARLRAVVALLVILLAAVLTTPARVSASEPARDLRTAPAVLVMIEDPGCPYCARWRAEVGPGYTRSEEGRFAPLVRRMRGDPDISFIGRVIYSPTFVLLVRGREVGRILGYPGADLFWMQVAGLYAQAGFKASPDPAGPAAGASGNERRS